jgi:hypothetical protein
MRAREVSLQEWQAKTWNFGVTSPIIAVLNSIEKGAA